VRERTDSELAFELAPGERRLARWAASAVPSRGRCHDEPACPTRSPFQRDRDRIIHSTAFRRLTHKTQVFVVHEGDHYRTRLTHSIEVAQIARTLARQLRLDEDLAEAIALAHDLGHPPFGHAGERALDLALAGCGGFDHNVQSFRLITRLERKYPDFDGLNLTWEALEGLIKHNGPPASAPGSRVCRALRHFDRVMSLALDRQAAAEAQVAALADDIAWHTHDIDDGLRAGLISLDDLATVALVAPLIEDLGRRHIGEPSRQIYAITRALITELMRDAVFESRRRLGELAPVGPDAVRAAPDPVVAFSTEMAGRLAGLRSFLFERLYRHSRVERVMRDAAAVVVGLVESYCRDEARLPEHWRAAASRLEERPRLRLIGDFVAGMTDRFALSEHRRLFDATPELR
jgi:dGTPase